MKKVILSVIAICILCALSLDSNSATPTNPKNESQEYYNPLKKIYYLKNKGALIVRLNTKSSSIEALKNVGRLREAERVKNNQQETNKEIIKAFKKYYNFSPVYFIYSDQSDYVKNKEFDKITFISEDLTPKKDIDFNYDFFLTAQFARLKRDNDCNQRDTRATKTEFSFSALIIKNSYFQQLCRPFPFYTRTLEEFIIRRSYDRCVSRQNEKLEDFYHRVVSSN